MESTPTSPDPRPLTPEPCSRVILLGASNLTMGLPIVWQQARWHCGGPLEVLVAAGHGRSYGMSSTVLGRTLPGITECGLWTALERQPEMPTAALITDVGNDLLYEQPVEQIVSWVEECLKRLRELNARIVATRLPLVNLDTLSVRRFNAIRAWLFPRCRLSLEEVADRARRLDARLCELWAAYAAAAVEPRRQWYGFDPIHVRWSRRRGAWREILGGWSDRVLTAPPASIDWRRRAQLIWLRPQRRWLLGREQCCPQPAAHWSDGESMALY